MEPLNNMGPYVLVEGSGVRESDSKTGERLSRILLIVGEAEKRY